MPIFRGSRVGCQTISQISCFTDSHFLSVTVTNGLDRRSPGAHPGASGQGLCPVCGAPNLPRCACAGRGPPPQTVPPLPRPRTPFGLRRGRNPAASSGKDQSHDFAKNGSLYADYIPHHRRPRTGRSSMVQTVERRARGRPHHAAPSPQRHTVSRHQRAHSLGRGDGAAATLARSG